MHRRSVCSLVVSAVCSAQLAAHAQPPRQTVPAEAEREGPGRVFGTVIDKVSGLPVEGARVRFHCLDSLRLKFATTDAAGKYDLTGLVTGAYNVRAKADGYVANVLGGTREGNVRASLHLSVAEHVRQADFALTRAATLSGTVSDVDGEPVDRCQVRALHRTDASPPVVWGRRGWGRTDENGHFEISDLEKGEYVVVAHAPKAVAERFGLQRFTTHYGGGFSLGLATPLAVAPGETQKGADIVLRGDGGKVLSGKVTSASDGAPVSDARVQISRRDCLTFEAELKTGEDGTYRVAALGEGPHQVTIDAREQGLARLSAWVEFGDGDLERTRDFALQRGATVSGWVESDDGKPIPPDVKLVLWVHPPKQAVTEAAGWIWGDEGSRRALQAGAQPEKRTLTDKTEFEIPACCPGPSKLWVGCYSDAYFVKQVIFGGTDPRVKPMDLQAGEPARDIRIVLSKQGGTLAGRVTVERTDEPVAYSSINVLLNDVAELATYGRTTGDASFQIRKLPPGEYCVNVHRKGPGLTIVNRGPHCVDAGKVTEVEIWAKVAEGEGAQQR